ncbi:uncharacterized protein TRAVEDRAFT_48184 [Trametes versicolor FP-101664 SS1]|uniref:uncharacterized protein n=1 Tax=Trametes versicolor (strain FP-101664) TaxID=717944 RepID=UPI0004624073|nr:uncharacterized protein TRAVEDRAFT_48184 [Trametes versicolor FP-101664 SS1]EIW57130.1 hypothetical protein TRAVEDRAFT_48184 [Trametes versicolor FP-101664 SS1]
MSHLEEALPMYTVSAVTVTDSQSVQVAPRMPPHRLFFALGRLPAWAAPPQPPQYERLPSSEDDVELKDVLPSPATASGAPTPAVPNATVTVVSTPAPTDSTGNPAPAPHSCAAEAVYNAVYYARMLVYLMLVGAAISTVASLIGFVLSMVAVLGFVSPTNRLPGDAALIACLAGGPIVGALAGLGGWLHLCVLHLLAARASARTALPTFQRLRAADENAADKEEVLYVMGGAALASVFALAVGLSVVPALAAVAREVGFSVGLALGVGVWGATVPFVPAIVGAVFTTLSDCNPASGAECMCCCLH